MAETCRHGVVGVEGRQTMNESSGSVEVTRTLVGKQGVSVVELSRAGARNRQEGQGRVCMESAGLEYRVQNHVSPHRYMRGKECAGQKTRLGAIRGG